LGPTQLIDNAFAAAANRSNGSTESKGLVLLQQTISPSKRNGQLYAFGPHRLNTSVTNVANFASNSEVLVGGQPLQVVLQDYANQTVTW